MTDLGSLLKTVAEKSSLLFGGAVAGLVFFLADLLGYVPAEHRTWILPIYWVCVFCFATLAYGALSALPEAIRIHIEKLRKRQEARLYGARNFEQLRTPHRQSLLFIKQIGTQRFPADGSRRIIHDMMDHHLLIHDNPGVKRWWENVTYFKVPDHIWMLMHQDGWGDGESHIRNVPWEENIGHRI
jgi:hypothetical protein